MALHVEHEHLLLLVRRIQGLRSDLASRPRVEEPESTIIDGVCEELDDMLLAIGHAPVIAAVLREPCRACGHTLGRHDGTGDQRCTVHRCSCKFFLRPLQGELSHG